MCPDPFLACESQCGLGGCHGTRKQPRASAHIPGSNPICMAEPWGQHSGNVSGWPGTAPQVHGGGEVCLFPQPRLSQLLLRPRQHREETFLTSNAVTSQPTVRTHTSGSASGQRGRRQTSSGMRRAECGHRRMCAWGAVTQSPVPVRVLKFLC